MSVLTLHLIPVISMPLVLIPLKAFHAPAILGLQGMEPTAQVRSLVQLVLNSIINLLDYLQ